MRLKISVIFKTLGVNFISIITKALLSNIVPPTLFRVCGHALRELVGALTDFEEIFFFCSPDKACLVDLFTPS